MGVPVTTCWRCNAAVACDCKKPLTWTTEPPGLMRWSEGKRYVVRVVDGKLYVYDRESMQWLGPLPEVPVKECE